MRKINILGLALFAVLAFGATVVASSAFAEPGQWLVNGAILSGTLNAETTGLLTLIRLVSETNSSVLTEIDCEGIFDGTITQAAGVKGTDIITELLNTAQELINELNETNPLALSCLVTFDSGALTDCKAETLAELWPDNLYNAAGPWLTELLELESNGLVLDGLSGKGVLGEEPGYEVRCETLLNVFGEELCEGPTEFDLTNGVGTVNSIASLTESPEVHCILGGTNEEKVAGLEGSGLLCATTATLVCVSETAVS